MSTTTNTTTGNVTWTFVSNHRPPEPPPAGACVPAPEPFPPGPLPWAATRLDEPAALTSKENA